MLRYALMCLTLLLVLRPEGAQAEWRSYAFEWQGAGGYVMRGGIGWNEDGSGGVILRENEVGCFFIEGERDGTPFNRWGLGMLGEETTWLLHFDKIGERFLVYGDDGLGMPQAWNMNGYGDDCGAEGFGFNIGSAAQDLCNDGQLLRESQITPARPLPAQRADVKFPAWACFGPALLSQSGPVERLLRVATQGLSVLWP